MLLEDLITHENDFNNIKINQVMFRKINDDVLCQIEKYHSIFKNFVLNQRKILKHNSGVPFVLDSFSYKGMDFDFIGLDEKNRKLFQCNGFCFKISFLENQLFFYLLNDGEIHSRFYLNDDFTPFVDFINGSDFSLINSIERFNVNVDFFIESPVKKDIPKEQPFSDTVQVKPCFEYESKPLEEQLKFSFDIYSFEQNEDCDTFSFDSDESKVNSAPIDVLSQLIHVKKHSRFNDLYYLRFIDYKILSLDTSAQFKNHYSCNKWLYDSITNEPYRVILKNKKEVTKPFKLEFNKGLNWSDNQIENARILELTQEGLNFLKPYDISEDETDMYQLNYGI